MPDVEEILSAEDRGVRLDQVALAKLQQRRQTLVDQLAAVEALSAALYKDAADTKAAALLSAA